MSLLHVFNFDAIKIRIFFTSVKTVKLLLYHLIVECDTVYLFLVLSLCNLGGIKV